MPILIREVTNEQVEQILELEENHFQDLKGKDIKPSKLSRSISAFSNASGGELYVGISEEKQGEVKIRTWNGFADVEDANAHIQVFEESFPLGQYFNYVFLKTEKQTGLVLKVEINKPREITTATNGVIYKRRAAQNLPVNTEEDIRRLEYDKGFVSFETEPVLVDIDRVTNSTVIIGFMLEVVPTAEPEAWLRKQLLIQNNKPTVGAILLFDEEPQAALPKRSAIKVYRYETKDEEGTRATLSFDPISIEGPLYDQIYNAVKQTTDIVEGIQIMGVDGLEKINYPNVALHEIITNAVLHRDYSIASDIHVRIFDNRIEVESPGTLPGHITKENILTEQFSRNGTVVRLIHKFPNPPNKEVGEGLNTAFDAMRSLRLKPPEIEDRENSVLVVIRHESLASPEESVMAFLDSHDEITNMLAREITGITSENIMKNVFYRLRNSDLIEQVPGKEMGPKAAWRLKQKN